VVIKLVTKKTHCLNCKKLVKGLEQKSNNQLNLICPKCDRLLWTHDGNAWRYVKADHPKDLGQSTKPVLSKPKAKSVTVRKEGKKIP
jgi:hypothetical protein